MPIHTISAVWKKLKTENHNRTSSWWFMGKAWENYPYFVSNFHSACLCSNIFAICRIVYENQHNRVREKVLVRPCCWDRKLYRYTIVQNVWRKEMIIRHCAAPSVGWKEKKRRQHLPHSFGTQCYMPFKTWLMLHGKSLEWERGEADVLCSTRKQNSNGRG